MLGAMEDLERLPFLSAKQKYQRTNLEKVTVNSYSMCNLMSAPFVHPPLREATAPLPVYLTSSMFKENPELSVLTAWVAATLCGIPHLLVDRQLISETPLLVKTTSLLATRKAS